MKHADQATLDRVEDLLQEIRKFQSLKEKKRGIFYWKSNAFLHFHDAGAQIFADLRRSDDWERFPVNTHEEAQTLLTEIAIALEQKR